jgi:hypothetical protein
MQGRGVGLKMLTLALYDANTVCRAALREGLEGTGAATVLHEGDV